MLIKELALFLDECGAFCISEVEDSEFNIPCDPVICRAWLEKYFNSIPDKPGDSIMVRAFTNPSPNRVKINIKKLDFNAPCYLTVLSDDKECDFDYFDDLSIQLSKNKLYDKDFYLEVKV